MKRYTVGDMVKLDTCYSRSKFRRMFGNRKYTNVARIAARKDVSPVDRAYVLTLMLNDKQGHVFAAKCAERLFKRLRRKNMQISDECRKALSFSRKMAVGPLSDEEDEQRVELAVGLYDRGIADDALRVASALLEETGRDAAMTIGGIMDDIADMEGIDLYKENRVQIKHLVEIMS